MGQYLRFCDITKSFSGVKALDSVSFEISQGSIHALLGENGAGKSTLLKVLSGYYTADEGEICIAGVSRQFCNPLEAKKSKVTVIPQELQLVSNQTVAENITLGEYSSKFKIVNWQRMYSSVGTFLQNNGIDIDARMKVRQLSIGKQQLVEIAKAVYHRAKIVAFDEPTSSLSKLETDILFHIIRFLKDQNVAIIYVSHRLSEVFDLCDSCTILKDGRHVVTKSSSPSLFSRDEIISYMTGKKIENIYNYRARLLTKNILDIQNISSRSLPIPLSLTVKKKEIVGIFGLVGAGRSELVRLIYGKEKIKSGKIIINSEIIRRHNPRNSILNGVMFCTEDRKKDGIIPGRPIWENINISSRRHFSFFSIFLNKSVEIDYAISQVNNLSIKASSIKQNVEYLSGGNQQKIVLARWLSERGLKVLIVDEPTRGIDIGAKHEIYQILFTLAERGVSIIVVSSDLPEIMGISDRIYVMREGVISKEVKREDFQEDLILEYAFPDTDIN